MAELNGERSGGVLRERNRVLVIDALRRQGLASRSELASWGAHQAGVTALTFSDDGAFLASGGVEGTLKLWNLPLIRRELATLGLDW